MFYSNAAPLPLPLCLAAGWAAGVRDNMKQSQPDYSLQLVIRGLVTPSCCPAPTAATRAELAI